MKKLVFADGYRIPARGETSWDHSSLGSGIYSKVLSQGNRLLAKSRFTVFR